TDLSGDPTFRELVGRTAETALGAHAHQDLPFEKLVETVAPGRDLRGSPLYCAWFVLQNNPMPELSAEGLELVPMDADGLLTKFDLALNLMETPAGIAGRFEYSTDLFDAGTVARLAAGYAALLQAAGRDPGLRLSLLAEAAAEAGRREKGLRQQEFQSALRSSLRGLPGARRRPTAQKGEAP
ncbi:MAG TPA: condensation domain-containing protein, partial [Thermoanaerobaculia bacterium]